MKSPLNIKEKAYEKQNRKMRSEYTSETGKKLGKRLTKGNNKRRVSFACRFAGMAGAMKDAKGPEQVIGFLLLERDQRLLLVLVF